MKLTNDLLTKLSGRNRDNTMYWRWGLILLPRLWLNHGAGPSLRAFISSDLCIIASYVAARDSVHITYHTYRVWYVVAGKKWKPHMLMFDQAWFIKRLRICLSYRLLVKYLVLKVVPVLRVRFVVGSSFTHPGIIDAMYVLIFVPANGTMANPACPMILKDP